MQLQSSSRTPIVIYQSADDSTATEVRLEGETVWLSRKQMAELFGKNIETINEHLGNVFKEGELDELSVIRNSRITAAELKTDGELKINDNALAAQSDSAHQRLMIHLIMNLIRG